jgi:small subunit ribosomal protein S1
MSFNINKQLNAEDQEPMAAQDATEATATTNSPEATPEVVVEEVVVAEAKPAYVPPVQTAHDDFDWSRDKRNVSSYTKEEKEKYDGVYDNTFKQINDGEMIQATIESLTKTDAVVNIGFKSDGLV